MFQIPNSKSTFYFPNSKHTNGFTFINDKAKPKYYASKSINLKVDKFNGKSSKKNWKQERKIKWFWSNQQPTKWWNMS